MSENERPAKSVRVSNRLYPSYPADAAHLKTRAEIQAKVNRNSAGDYGRACLLIGDRFMKATGPADLQRLFQALNDAALAAAFNNESNTFSNTDGVGSDNESDKLRSEVDAATEVEVPASNANPPPPPPAEVRRAVGMLGMGISRGAKVVDE